MLLTLPAIHIVLSDPWRTGERTEWPPIPIYEDPTPTPLPIAAQADLLHRYFIQVSLVDLSAMPRPVRHGKRAVAV